MDNVSLLQKADLTIADLSSNGGLLLPEQGATFIRKLIKQSTLLPQVRTVEMNASTRKINKIQFASRILRAAVSGQAPSAGQRSKPTTEQIQLNTKEVIAVVYLPYDVIEDNIERAITANNEASNDGPGAFRNTIIELIAERAASDLEEGLLMGDSTYVNGGDADDQAYIRLWEGYLKRAAVGGNVVDAGNATVAKELFKSGMKALPVQYQKNIPNMKHFISMNNEIEYRDTLANRGTSMGDSFTTGQAAAYAYASKVEGIQYMPGDKGLYTNPLNLIFGIQRQVSMEFDKDIEARVYKIVLTARVDCQVEEDDAVVYYQNIAA
ncbi:capsid protein [Rhizobium phage RHph_TM16]|nr:capsid protein [Rhizobium phage RHph_TM16]